MKLLIIEDDESVQLLLREVAGTEGWDVRVGSTAATLEAASAWPDVVILDLHLPGGGALEALEGLRASGSMVPVVVVTGDGSLRAEAQSFPGVRFMTKPFEVPELLEAIRLAAAG